MESKKLVFVVFSPISHADVIRQALGEAGAGRVGDYDFCSFSSRGMGRFRGSKKTNPVVGEAGRLEAVEEERIEASVPREILHEVIEKVKAAHPYEEVPFYAYPLEDV